MGTMESEELNTSREALVIDRAELDETEEQAIELTVAESGSVQDVRVHHRELLREQLEEAGVTYAGGTLREADRRSDQRESHLGHDHLLGKLPEGVIGQENDENRVITYAGAVAHSSVSSELQEGLKRHETQHKLQQGEAGESSETPEQVMTFCRAEVEDTLHSEGIGEISNVTMTSTFDAVAARTEWNLGRLAYRERNSVEKGEGVTNTSAEYRREYVEPTRNVERMLGGDGARLVEEAGLTQDGYRKVRARILGVFMARKLKQEEVMK
jgi:hypothetical protein